jgi:hypothetical protein
VKRECENPATVEDAAIKIDENDEIIQLSLFPSASSDNAKIIFFKNQPPPPKNSTFGKTQGNKVIFFDF